MQAPAFGDLSMRSCVAAFFLAPLLAGAALAGSVPFEGRWGWTADDCDLAPGESDMVPIEIGNGVIDYYESTCTIDRVEPVGGGDGGRRQLIEIDLEAGFVVVRQDCGAAQ